jgi:hypothetical protein
MNIEDFKGLMDEFDPLSLLPEVSEVTGAIGGIARFIVLIGPVVLLVMGLLYRFATPKEANHHWGYRTYFGMGSVEAWLYSQHLAGYAFGGLGLLLSIVMLPVTGSFSRLDTMALLNRAVSCMIWEAVLTLIVYLAVNLILIARFDKKGDLRKNKVRR